MVLHLQYVVNAGVFLASPQVRSHETTKLERQQEPAGCGRIYSGVGPGNRRLELGWGHELQGFVQDGFAHFQRTKALHVHLLSFNTMMNGGEGLG